MSEASKDEQIGFHKGSLAVLAKEREEMSKIVSIVEQLMQAHIKALQDLGVDVEAAAQEAGAKPAPIVEPKGTDKKIDELI